MRRARLGLLSVAAMVERRWAALGESETRIGSPEGPVRGWRIGCASCGSDGEEEVASEVVARDRRRGDVKVALKGV